MKKSIFVLLIFLVACASPAVVPTVTSLPPTITNTPAPSSTPTIIPSPTITPIPDELIDEKGITMRLVPAGEFTMGNKAEDTLAECQKVRSDCQLDLFKDEEPIHQVYLDAFYMDIYEVTKAAYKVCVEAGACTPPEKTLFYNPDSYYADSQYDNHPMIFVDWDQANTYCEWRGGSLPTEAQWEKAARGTDGRIYPWGEQRSCDQANSLGCVGDDLNAINTVEVGSYESGKSPYGMYDMAGNVSEWTADWYDSSYYANSPSSNPLGPSSGDHHVARGGSFYAIGVGISSVNRDTNNGRATVGFRCAKDAP